MRLIFRPLTSWPADRKPETWRKSATFKAPWDKTVSELGQEMDRIDGEDVVLQVDVTERECRIDGGLHSQARPASPRVVLTFTKPLLQGGKQRVPVSIACDVFDTWRDNVRAIRLTLEDLRRIERYGTAPGGQQYRGFTAIAATSTVALSTDQAADVVAKRSGNTSAAAAILADIGIARTAVRLAMNKAHPDVGGNSGEFTLVTEAGRVLAAHHGVTSL